MPVTLPLGSSRPSLTLLSAEPWRATMEFVSFQFNHFLRTIAGNSCDGKAGKPGDGHPVIIFPGLGGDGSAVVPLRNHCNSLGYETIDWGSGYNTGSRDNLDAWIGELALHIDALTSRYDQPATFIGWSLGGIYAREIAKLLAPRVRQVITIGTPFNADTDLTNIGWMHRLASGASADIAPAVSKRLRTPPPVPTTSIYSRSDGLVAWQTCVHAAPSHEVQDIEIDGSHVGLGWNPAVLDIVANRLGQQPSNWQPYTMAA